MKKYYLYIIISLIVLSLGLGSYIIYDKINNDKETTKEEKTKDENDNLNNEEIEEDNEAINLDDSNSVLIDKLPIGILHTITIDEFKNLVDSKENFIILFSQTTCGHCTLFKPVLESVATTYKIEVYVLEVNELTNEEFAYLDTVTTVRSTPILAFFKKGKEEVTKRLSGEKTEEALIKKLEEYEYLNRKIPDVSGKTIEEAINILKDNGFVVNSKKEEIESKEIEENLVVKTSPSIGTKRSYGSSITLYVSKKTEYIVEDYVAKNENYINVKKQLELYGINVEIITKDVDDTSKYKEGQIIEQSVKEGSILKVGDTIKLIIPNISIVYPDFTNYSLEEIKNFCNNYNINLVIEYEESNENSETVIYQSKVAGSKVIENQKLIIKIAK